MVALQELMETIERGNFRWVNIIGFINGYDDLEFMLKPYDVYFEEDTLIIDTDQLSYKIRISGDVTYNDDWGTYEFSSERIDYVLKFLNALKER